VAAQRPLLSPLHELGLLEKPHRSAGRIPTELGLRVFVRGLPERELAPFEKRELEGHLAGEGRVEGASRLLTERTRHS